MTTWSGSRGDGRGLMLLVSLVALVVDCVCFAGLQIANPNEGRAVQLFGTYPTPRDRGF